VHDDLLIDLAADGKVLQSSDQFFAAASNLLKPTEAVPAAGRITTRGRWADGWVTRRRRGPTGHDWALIRLGRPGVLHHAVIDTRGLEGEEPAECSLEAASMPGDPGIVDLVRSRERWEEVVPRSPVGAGARNEFPVTHPEPVTHIRLVVYPDGGVTRLRCLGEPIPPPGLLDGETGVDLASIANGGLAVACSDHRFGAPGRMLRAGKPRDPGEGWETRRERRSAPHWVVVRLAGPGAIDRIEIDTTGYEGSTPESCRIEAVRAPGAGPAMLDHLPWQHLLPDTPLDEGRLQVFTDLAAVGEVTHLRLQIHPDGGIARFRAFGIGGRPWHEAG